MDSDAKLDFSRDMNYGDYLHLDQVLSAQHPLSPDHNEMLFIVQHQTSELWMKLMLHELRAAVANVASDELQPAFKMLSRVSRIMEQLVHAWDVLATMTPPEYSAIRPTSATAAASRAGNTAASSSPAATSRRAMLDRIATTRFAWPKSRRCFMRPVALRRIAAAAAAAAASRCPTAITATRDVTQQYIADPGVEEAWLQVYRDPDAHWDLYQLGEELVDLEDVFRLWRFRHLTTVRAGHRLQDAAPAVPPESTTCERCSDGAVPRTVEHPQSLCPGR